VRHPVSTTTEHQARLGLGTLGLAAGIMLAYGNAAFASPVIIKYLFDAPNGSGGFNFTNPGLDSTISIPAALGTFLAWSDTDATLTSLNGQGGTDKAVAARSWDGTGNAFNFSFNVASGWQFTITQIDFWEQGSSGTQGLGPTTWGLAIDGNNIVTGTPAFRGSPGQSEQISGGALSTFGADLSGTVTFNISASGAAETTAGAGNAGNATWRIDNFQITGDLTPVPLPAAVWMFGVAIAGLAGARRVRA
jgi:hypothetical protein